MKNQKWTKINVHFQKSQNTFEKTLHHSLIRHPPGAFFKYLWGIIYICKGLKELWRGGGEG
jgi:hypothetical protein